MTRAWRSGLIAVVLLLNPGRQVVLACSDCLGPITLSLGNVIDPIARTAPGGRAFALAPPGPFTRCWHPMLGRSTDGGLSFSTLSAIGIDCRWGTVDMGWFPDLAADGSGRLYVGWFPQPDGRGGALSVAVKSSPDDGQTWPEPPVDIAGIEAGPTQMGGKPQLIAATGGQAWVFWGDRPGGGPVVLWSSATGDAGRTWSATVRVDGGAPEETRSYQVARGDDGILHVLVRAGAANVERVRHGRSLDGGQSWTPLVAIDGLTLGAACSLGSLLTGPAGAVVAVWSDRRDGEADVYASTSLDSGASWPSAPVRMDGGDAPGAAASILPAAVPAGSPAQVAAVWLDRRDTGTNRVFANHSEDFGRTWELEARPVSDPVPAPGTGYPMIAADPGEEAVTLAWWVGSDIFRAVSCDGGRSYSLPALLDPTVTIGSPYTMLVGYPGAAAGFLWQDNGQGIHHRRLDGPVLVRSSGADSYCLGADPVFAVDFTSAACATPAFQWRVDGAPVAGATGSTFKPNPSLAPGSHAIEVSASCPVNPACIPESRPRTVEVRAPRPPAAVGNVLRAVRAVGTSEVQLDWGTMAPDGAAHAHATRASGRSGAHALVAPDPGFVATSLRDLPPAGEPLLRYRILRADVCESESAD